MKTTIEKIAETIQTSAAEMAQKLDMRRAPKLEWRAMTDDDLMMLVAPNGITLGRMKVHYGERRTYRYEIYMLNGVDLLEKRYGITESGWEHMPTVTVKLDADTIIYTGW